MHAWLCENPVGVDALLGEALRLFRSPGSQIATDGGQGLQLASLLVGVLRVPRSLVGRVALRIDRHKGCEVGGGRLAQCGLVYYIGNTLCRMGDTA